MVNFMRYAIAFACVGALVIGCGAGQAGQDNSAGVDVAEVDVVDARDVPDTRDGDGPDPDAPDADVEPPDDGAVYPDYDPDASCTIEDTRVFEDDSIQAPPFFAGVDLKQFTRFPEYDPAMLTPGNPVDYWEKVLCYVDYPPYDCQVVRSFGTKCANASDKVACEAEFDALIPDNWVPGGCAPLSCFDFMRANRGDDNFLTYPGTLFSPIDSANEVRFLTSWIGYTCMSQDASACGYRRVEDGWEVLVGMLHQPCFPITYDRVLLHVSTEAIVTPICRQIYIVDWDACI